MIQHQKDGSRYSDIQVKAHESKPYQSEMPSGGQHCKALSTADHDFKGAYQRDAGGHSDCESKSSGG